MEGIGMKIKGTITSLLSLMFSLDGVAVFVLFAFLSKGVSLVVYLFIAMFFLFESAGRLFALSHTFANRKAKDEEAKKEKMRLALMMGIAETIYPLPWFLAIFSAFSLVNDGVAFVPLAALLFKTSAELVLAFFRLLPFRKKAITMASESLCSLCITFSLFASFFLVFLTSKGILSRDLAEPLSGGIFLALFLIQNVFFSILLFQGGLIKRIKTIVNFGVKYSIGNYIVINSSLMTFIASTVSAIQQKNWAYAGIAWIYLTLGAIRLASLLWRNAIQRNVFNKQLAQESENKILIFAGGVLALLSVFFSWGIVWTSQQGVKPSAAFVLIIQIAYGVFRLFLCIKNYIVYQKQNLPFSIAVASLDLLIGVYSSVSLFLLIDSYLHFSWLSTGINILAACTFFGALALGVIMIWLGIRGTVKYARKKKELEANSKALLTILSQKGIELRMLSLEEASSLNGDPSFTECLLRYRRIGAIQEEEEKFYLSFEKAEEKGEAEDSSPRL